MNTTARFVQYEIEEEVYEDGPAVQPAQPQQFIQQQPPPQQPPPQQQYIVQQPQPQPQPQPQYQTPVVQRPSVEQPRPVPRERIGFGLGLEADHEAGPPTPQARLAGPLALHAP
jgi:hypothetical protein